MQRTRSIYRVCLEHMMCTCAGAGTEVHYMPKPGLASSLWAWADGGPRSMVGAACALQRLCAPIYILCSNKIQFGYKKTKINWKAILYILILTLTRISYFLFHTHLRLITLALFLLYNCTTNTNNDHVLLSLYYCLLCIVPDAGQSSRKKISGKSAATRAFGSSSIGPRSHAFPLFSTWTRSPGPWKSAAICYCFIALYVYRHVWLSSEQQWKRPRRQPPQPLYLTLVRPSSAAPG